MFNITAAMSVSARAAVCEYADECMDTRPVLDVREQTIVMQARALVRECVSDYMYWQHECYLEKHGYYIL